MSNPLANAPIFPRRLGRAAVEWCEHANQHAAEYGGKPFSYLLIPHDEINHMLALTGSWTPLQCPAESVQPLN